jgi:hypothetical protein
MTEAEKALIDAVINNENVSALVLRVVNERTASEHRRPLVHAAAELARARKAFGVAWKAYVEHIGLKGAEPLAALYAEIGREGAALAESGWIDLPARGL